MQNKILKCLSVEWDPSSPSSKSGYAKGSTPGLDPVSWTCNSKEVNSLVTVRNFISTPVFWLPPSNFRPHAIEAHRVIVVDGLLIKLGVIESCLTEDKPLMTCPCSDKYLLSRIVTSKETTAWRRDLQYRSRKIIYLAWKAFSWEIPPKKILFNESFKNENGTCLPLMHSLRGSGIGLNSRTRDSKFQSCLVRSSRDEYIAPLFLIFD